jgi:hypothetical protein
MAISNWHDSPTGLLLPAKSSLWHLFLPNTVVHRLIVFRK